MSTTFTGRHAALVIGGGFLVVIAVNLTLAVVATRSHPGLVVENSYVASQKFNDWLAAGRTQKALGWKAAPAVDATTLSIAMTDARGAPLEGLRATATLNHPLGAEPPREVALVETAPGTYAAPHGLAAGQWIVEARLARGSETFYLDQRLFVPR